VRDQSCTSLPTPPIESLTKAALILFAAVCLLCLITLCPLLLSSASVLLVYVVAAERSRRFGVSWHCPEAEQRMVAGHIRRCRRYVTHTYISYQSNKPSVTAWWGKSSSCWWPPYAAQVRSTFLRQTPAVALHKAITSVEIRKVDFVFINVSSSNKLSKPFSHSWHLAVSCLPAASGDHSVNPLFAHTLGCRRFAVAPSPTLSTTSLPHITCLLRMFFSCPLWTHWPSCDGNLLTAVSLPLLSPTSAPRSLFTQMCHLGDI
jgi:hypothetical protein